MVKIQSTSIFATAPTGTSTPDSLTVGHGSIWAEYSNTAGSAGGSGNSTIVQYRMNGAVQNSYSLPGGVDGLKFDPKTGDVWALQNQDGNSTLTLLNPATHQISSPLSYGPPYVYGANSTRGYDDVAFDHHKVFVSYSNPASPGDPVIEQLVNGNAPFGTLSTTSILRLGDTGTNLVTGQTNQPLPVIDPDSLKTLPDGSLILTSEQDHALTIIHHPGTPQQSAGFIQLPAGDSPDDAIVPTSTSGTFYIANGKANDVLKVQVSGLNRNDIYASIQQENALVQIDPNTGQMTPILTGLNNPHGLAFVPSSSPVWTPLSTHANAIPDLVQMSQGIQHALATDLVPPASGQATGGAAGPLLPSSLGSLSAYASMTADQIRATLPSGLPPTQHA